MGWFEVGFETFQELYQQLMTVNGSTNRSIHRVKFVINKGSVEFYLVDVDMVLVLSVVPISSINAIKGEQENVVDWIQVTFPYSVQVERYSK